MSLYAYQIEQAVLAAMLVVDNCFENYQPKLTEDDFYVAAHQLVFRELTALVLTGQPADIVALAEHMKANHTIKQIGGEEFFNKLLAESPASFFNVNSYAEKLRDLTRRRKLSAIADQIKTLAENPDCVDYIEQAQALTSSMTGTAANGYRYSLQDACLEALEITEKRIERASGKHNMAYGVNTGLDKLDAVLGDIEPSHLTVIAAQPGAGKTTLAQMIAINAVKHNNAPTLFISAEMSAAQVASRMIAAEAAISFTNLKKGSLSDEEWGKLANFTAKAGSYPLDIVDISGPSIALIRAEANKTQQKHGKVGCIIVDYIQLLQDPTQKNRFDEVSAVSRGLKALAKDFNCPVIALSQLTKSALNRKPGMADLRESGQIAQDADHIVMLYTADEKEKEGFVTTINVEKNRHGATKEVKAWQLFEFCRFADIPEKEGAA